MPDPDQPEQHPEGSVTDTEGSEVEYEEGVDPTNVVPGDDTHRLRDG